jgi:hypothetical protein
MPSFLVTEMGSQEFLLWVASSHQPSDVCFPSSLDYRSEPSNLTRGREITGLRYKILLYYINNGMWDML